MAPAVQSLNSGIQQINHRINLPATLSTLAFLRRIEQSNTLLLLYLTLLYLLCENSKFLCFHYITGYFSLINAIKVRGELDGHFLT